MSEQCKACKSLNDPCLCFYSNRELMNELLRRTKK